MALQITALLRIKTIGFKFYFICLALNENTYRDAFVINAAGHTLLVRVYTVRIHIRIQGLFLIINMKEANSS
jgi:hypothetical protein